MLRKKKIWKLRSHFLKSTQEPIPWLHVEVLKDIEGTEHNPFPSLHRQGLHSIIITEWDGINMRKPTQNSKNFVWKSSFIIQKVQVKAKNVLFLFLFPKQEKVWGEFCVYISHKCRVSVLGRDRFWG